ncbi:hypothetical protein OD350_18065 [Clostridium beijerinckii]|uniref:PepSY domain-containing protein n=1 Tax=Clostridium beijerinckii TaxID=1520 RepID=A0AAX0B7Z4_CLOBE|nr:hypothetical protein [Clostridium beijerinckii]NRT91515.1 hypothetical protein [Clostridium beijerinckii]NYC71040.1 hypothetical protein [Clostridium beijerinckii]UYZ34150.1 hypothetical protein OD350_18065 [Clostridium beijerinckii]
MKIKDIISDKKKIVPLSIGILCLLSVGAYGTTSVYKNYQETQIQQAKEEKKNRQIDQAKEKVKKILDDKMSGVKCEAKYDLKNSSDNTLTITVTFDDSKNTTINCDFKRTDDSVDFNDESSFEKVLNKFIDEEKKAEIRHTVIYDYQDMLYGMRGKMSNRWDKVKFSKNDDDYIVQETSDRFFGGNKAYLVTIDSEWIAKNGDSEWKHICLHMEYDKDNKLIDAKYGDYDKIDPDKDIKDGVRTVSSTVGAEATSNTSEVENTKTKITQKDAVGIVKKAKNVDESVSFINGFSNLDKTVEGIKYYEIEVASKTGRGAASTYYVNSQTGEIIDLISNENKFNKISNSK